MPLPNVRTAMAINKQLEFHLERSVNDTVAIIAVKTPIPLTVSFNISSKYLRFTFSSPNLRYSIYV